MVNGRGKYKSLKGIENITFSLVFKWKWFNFGRNYISFISIGAGCWPHHAAGVTAPPRSNSLYLIPSVRQLLLLKLRGPRSAGHRYLSRSATGGKKKKNYFELLNAEPYLSQCIAWKVWGQLTRESCSYLKMQGSLLELELTAWFCPGLSNLFFSPAGQQHHPTPTEPIITSRALMWTKDTPSRSQKTVIIN